MTKEEFDLLEKQIIDKKIDLFLLKQIEINQLSLERILDPLDKLNLVNIRLDLQIKLFIHRNLINNLPENLLKLDDIQSLILKNSKELEDLSYKITKEHHSIIYPKPKAIYFIGTIDY